MTETVAPVSILSATQCWDRLHSNAFARLALSVGDRPEIFPINYVVQGGTLLFRTSQGTKLAALTINESVALEIDGYDSVGGWSVVVKGKATELNQMIEIFEATDLPLFPWLTSPKPRFVRIIPDSITGRSFRRVQAGQ